MADADPTAERLRDLADDYLDGTIDADGLRELEALLAADASARQFFARYTSAHAGLVFDAVSRDAAERVLARIDAPTPAAPLPLSRRAGPVWAAAALALGMFIGGGAVGLLAPAGAARPVAPTPRTLELDFRSTVPGTLADSAGLGTGLSHRLPGTGTALGPHDANLRLVPEAGRLELTATASDLNTRFRLEQAEFPGVRLADLGFTGDEDFEVSVTAADIPSMGFVGQFGVFAGTTGDWAVRGGLVGQREPDSSRQFLVNTRDGRDKDAYFVGIGTPGDDLRITLSRVAGRYAMAAENRTSGATSTLSIRRPEFLDRRADLTAGLFASDPRGKDHKPVRFVHFTATVWIPPGRGR